MKSVLQLMKTKHRLLNRKIHENNMKNRGSTLITKKDTRPDIIEAYRTFSTNIKFSNLECPAKTILITSSTPSEGKSTTVANLGIVMAQAGNKIADGDLNAEVKVVKTGDEVEEIGNTMALLTGAVKFHLKNKKK